MAMARVAWLILGLALLSAVASSFGSGVGLWGFDLGSVGGTVFGFTLWIAVGVFVAIPDRVFPQDWSIAERRAWAGAFFVLLILLAYLRFMLVLRGLPEIPDTLGELPASSFSWNLGVLLIGWAVMSSSIRGRDPQIIESDERDLRLRRAADRVGDWLLTILIAWCVGLLVAQPESRLAWWLAPLVAANVLVGILIVKTFVEHAYLVGRYAWDRR